jgi:hypothetical protein
MHVSQTRNALLTGTLPAAQYMHRRNRGLLTFAGQYLTFALRINLHKSSSGGTA